MALVIAVLPLPARVRVKVAPLMPPLRVRVLAVASVTTLSLWMAALESSVIAPDQVLLPLTLRKAPRRAPLSVAPGPFRVRSLPKLLVLVAVSRSSSVPPVFTVTRAFAPVPVPSAPLWLMARMPLLIVVVPV